MTRLATITPSRQCATHPLPRAVPAPCARPITPSRQSSRRSSKDRREFDQKPANGTLENRARQSPSAISAHSEASKSASAVRHQGVASNGIRAIRENASVRKRRANGAHELQRCKQSRCRRHATRSRHAFPDPIPSLQVKSRHHVARPTEESAPTSNAYAASIRSRLALRIYSIRTAAQNEHHMPARMRCCLPGGDA